MSNSNIKTSIFDIKSGKRERGINSEPLLSLKADSYEEPSEASEAISAVPKIKASKSINWKYIALAIPTLAVFFMLVKVVSEPVEPIIIMDEPTLQIATASAEANLEVQSPSDNASNALLLPNESIETLPSAVNLPAEALMAKEVATNDAEKSELTIDITVIDKTPQELVDIELVKKKAKQKAKKKAAEAMQQSLVTTNPQIESQPQQSIVVQQKEPAIAAEAPKDTMKDATKEAVKAPVQEKSPWSKFADSIKKGGEAPCTPAQIAMNQCS